MKFEVYETTGGHNRWRLVSGNGQEVANSGENFASHSNAQRAAESFKSHAGGSNFEIYASGDQWRWRAKSSNGQIVASSGEPFVSESNAQRAADNVRENAGGADGP